MGMPITVELVDTPAGSRLIDEVYAYFIEIDNRFSTYKPDSEISRLNDGRLTESACSSEMTMILRLCEETKRATGGYFDSTRGDVHDPSGLVKGWAIYQAAQHLRQQGCTRFMLEAGGDIQVSGSNAEGAPWRVGIRNPLERTEIVKTVMVSHEGVATSGSYIRGQHVYNPHLPDQPLTDVVSLTVIGPNIYEADRFATAAFAMGTAGIGFIEKLAGFEGYMITNRAIATMTTGFDRYVSVS
jgi:thiamine biosynthesis lipoprotein